MGFFQLRNIGEKIRRLVFKKFVKTCRDDLDIRKQINHHLHITLTEFSYPSEELEIYFSLYSTKENCYVSEKVLMPALPSSENNDQGLFTTHCLYRFLDGKKKRAASNLAFQALEGFIGP